MGIRESVERTIVNRCKAVMVRAGMSVDAATPNPDLNDPLASALEQLGSPPADRFNVTDADVAAVPADLPMLIDLAEIRTLESALVGVVTRATRQVWRGAGGAGYEVDNQTLAGNVREAIAMKWESYLQRWMQNKGAVVGRMNPSRGQLFDPAPLQPPFRTY